MTLSLHWHPEPDVLDGIVVLSILYALAVGPMRRILAPGEPFPRRQAALFYAGVALLFLAVGSPLEEISEKYLFSAHMFQHVLLIYPIPILWLLGTPEWVMKPWLEMEWSRPILRFLTQPVVSFAVFNGLFYAWHLPGFYEWALRDSKIHFLEHATFMGASLLAWWPILGPANYRRLNFGGQLLYLLAGAIAQLPLFGMLVFANAPFYPTYRDAERITWMTPVDDQQLGAIIMKLSAMVVMFSTMVWIFYGWWTTSERKSQG